VAIQILYIADNQGDISIFAEMHYWLMATPADCRLLCLIRHAFFSTTINPFYLRPHAEMLQSSRHFFIT